MKGDPTPLHFLPLGVLVCVALVLLLGAWLGPEDPVEEATPLNVSAATDQAPRVEEQMREALLGSAQPEEVPMESGGESGDKPLPIPIDLQRGELPWEKQIAAVLAAPGLDRTAQARTLLGLLGNLPPDAHAAAAEEVTARLPDKDYRLALPAVTDPKTSGAAMAVLFDDLMQRPDEITLPALLAIARQPAHPWAPAARDNLDLLVGADHGTDWPAWERAVARVLAEGQNQ